MSRRDNLDALPFSDYADDDPNGQLRIPDSDPATCAECGHLHWFGPAAGYGPCPLTPDCDCRGQVTPDALRHSR